MKKVKIDNIVIDSSIVNDAKREYEHYRDDDGLHKYRFMSYLMSLKTKNKSKFEKEFGKGWEKYYTEKRLKKELKEFGEDLEIMEENEK